jgi:hypothetical protein
MDAAREAGQPTPGRPKLVTLTGASDYQVRKALAALETQPTSLGESPASTSSPASAISPAATSSPAPAVASDPGDSPAICQPASVASQPASPAHLQPVTSGAGDSPARQPVSRRQPRTWPLLVIGLAAAVAVWSGWVGLGKLAGFGVIQPLPGIWDSLRLDTAVVLPISVEAYAAYALRVWLSTDTRSARTVRFARFSTMASLVIGAGAQVAYHLMAAAGYTRAPWPVVTLVAIVPVVVLGLASALAKLVTSDSTSDRVATTNSPGMER